MDIDAGVFYGLIIGVMIGVIGVLAYSVHHYFKK